MTALSLITNPHQPGDLILPMARVLHVPDPGTHLSDIDELPYRLGGRSKKPSKALAYRDRDGNTTLICGLGIAEAAEIQDMAYRLYEKQRVSDYETQDERRARAGLPTRQQTIENIREAMQAKADYFRRNSVTGRVGNYDPTEKSVF